MFCSTVCVKRNACLIPNFFGGGGTKIPMVHYVNRTPIYIIDHVNILSPSPRGATKKLELNVCFFLQKMYMYIL